MYYILIVNEDSTVSGHIPRAELVFEAEVECDPPSMLGKSNGGDAMMIPILGGKVSGPALQGSVLPGGADWAVKREDGVFCIDARYAIKTGDGVVIQVFNRGKNAIDPATNPTLTMLTSPSFVAPDGPYAWLNDAVFVGTVTPLTQQRAGVHVSFFKLV